MELAVFLNSHNYLGVCDAVSKVLHLTAPSNILTKHEFRLSLLNQHICLCKQSLKMDNGDLFRTTRCPSRCIETNISALQSPVRKASDADTWLLVTHLPCHHGLRKKCLTACLQKRCQAILKCTADLQGNEADDISVSTAPQAPCRTTCH